MSRLERLDNENRKRPDNGRDFYFEEKDNDGKVVNIFDNKEKYIQYLSDFLRAEFDRKDDEKAEQEQTLDPTKQTKAEIQWFKNRPSYDRALASMNQDMPKMEKTDREWFKNRESNHQRVATTISNQLQENVQPKVVAEKKRRSALVEGKVNYRISPEKAQQDKIVTEAYVKEKMAKDKIFIEAYAGYKKANKSIIQDKSVKKVSWLSKAWTQLNKPFAGLKQVAREFGNALYVPEQVNVYKFMQVLNDRFAGQMDQYDAAMQVAVIDKFVTENRLSLTHNSYNELIERKQNLVKGLRENKYAKFLVTNDKPEYMAKKARLASLKLLADVNVNPTRDKNGKALLEVNFGEDKRLVNYSVSLMKTGLDEIMYELRDKKMEYRARQAKKALATAGLMIGLMFLPHDSIQGKSSDVDQSGSVIKKSNISFNKDDQSVKQESVQLDVAEQELAKIVDWNSIKEIALENNIYLDRDVKEFMTDRFVGEMTHELNRNLVLNHTNLVSDKYKTFAEFKAVCAFYDSHIDFFKGHPENVNLLKNNPELMSQANDIDSLTIAAVVKLGLKGYCQEMGIDYKLAKEVCEFNPELLTNGAALRSALNTLDNLSKVVYSDSDYEPVNNYVEPVNNDINIQNAYNESNYSQACEQVNQTMIKPDITEMLSKQRDMNRLAKELEETNQVVTPPAPVLADGGIDEDEPELIESDESAKIEDPDYKLEDNDNNDYNLEASITPAPDLDNVVADSNITEMAEGLESEIESELYYYQENNENKNDSDQLKYYQEKEQKSEDGLNYYWKDGGSHEQKDKDSDLKYY